MFPILLEEIVPLCCGNCSEGDGPSSISYVSYKQENLVNIKKIENLDGSDRITFPISGKKNDRFYQNEYRFMPLISSPGVAFIVVDEPPGTSANAVFNSVLSGWPVLLLTLLMALLSGIIMWGLVSMILTPRPQFSCRSRSNDDLAQKSGEHGPMLNPEIPHCALDTMHKS